MMQTPVEFDLVVMTDGSCAKVFSLLSIENRARNFIYYREHMCGSGSHNKFIMNIILEFI